jgi:adenosylmethionine-8-amino-7-oxononanoate aminotransferase
MSTELIKKDQKYIWHPFTPQKPQPEAIGIVKGEGSLLFDEEGKEYIDAISSWWVTLHGHGHPYIAEKLYRQALTLEQVIFAGFTHAPAVNLAERLMGILPGDFSKVFYSDNGSTSTEVAIKMAIQYWRNKREIESGKSKMENGIQNTFTDVEAVSGEEGLLAFTPLSGREGPGVSIESEIQSHPRKKILAFKNSYHGDTFGAMSVSDRGVFTLAFHDMLFEVIFIDTPTTENIGDIKAIIHEHGHEIACFIYEPLVQGAGGMKMTDPYLLNELLNTAKLNEIICIADEVMTGFGRTGRFFASEYLQKKPDIICLSKGLTGGTMALGVTACTEKIHSAFVTDDKLHTFFHGHSFTANPLACTAALASLDLLEKESCLEKIEWICEQQAGFIESLRNNEELYPNKIRNPRQIGTIAAFEISSGADEYLNSISGTITSKCMEQGVYLRPLGNTVYIMPPYCITLKELEKVYTVLLSVLRG